MSILCASIPCDWHMYNVRFLFFYLHTVFVALLQMNYNYILDNEEQEDKLKNIYIYII